MGFEMSRSLMSVLQASRLRPLMRMASEPQMPCAHDRRNVSEPSCSHLILCSASSTRSVAYISTSKSCQRGSVSTSGSNRRIRKVTVNDWIAASVDLASSVAVDTSVLPFHRLVTGDRHGFPVEPDVVLCMRGLRIAREVGHRVLHVVRVVAVREVVAHMPAAALFAVAGGVDDDLGEIEE